MKNNNLHGCYQEGEDILRIGEFYFNEIISS